MAVFLLLYPLNSCPYKKSMLPHSSARMCWLSSESVSSQSKDEERPAYLPKKSSSCSSREGWLLTNSFNVQRAYLKKGDHLSHNSSGRVSRRPHRFRS